MRHPTASARLGRDAGDCRLRGLQACERLRGEDGALEAVAAMQKTRVIALSDELALVAADLSLEHKLAMADAIVLATARFYDAEVITSDSDFEDIPGVIYIPRRAGG
ncbi:MAG TPA: type II toxin-antitoxin system VapC family toxin [Thermoanaerobaculia bacterium]|nr:type II toxin-antitoxin system VapC family toxin [Thermoanaerobaculia bacterium]